MCKNNLINTLLKDALFVLVDNLLLRGSKLVFFKSYEEGDARENTSRAPGFS